MNEKLKNIKEANMFNSFKTKKILKWSLIIPQKN